jgi:hypothetical protein
MCYASESATKETELSLNQVQLTKLEKISVTDMMGLTCNVSFHETNMMRFDKNRSDLASSTYVQLISN